MNGSPALTRALFGVCVLTMACLPAHAMQAIGEARSADSGELRYTEHHQCTEAGASCRVDYRDTSGELFASKQLDYSASLHAPSLVMEHFVEESTVRVEKEAQDMLVVDAGFDNFIRSHWQTLASGERIEFEFLPAGRDSPLSMRAERELDESCPSERLCLNVALDNWFLSALVPPIRLQYDRENQRLLRYAGLSNLRDSNGEQQQVLIDYRYESESP